jgi:outer membrane receptor for ferric coprogen and ferric-rhodotorulic acid
MFAKIDHRFNDDRKINVSYTEPWDVGYFKSATAKGVGVNQATGGGLTWRSNVSKQENQQRMWDTNVAGTFELMGLQHDLVTPNVRTRACGTSTIPRPIFIFWAVAAGWVAVSRSAGVSTWRFPAKS